MNWIKLVFSLTLLPIITAGQTLMDQEFDQGQKQYFVLHNWAGDIHVKQGKTDKIKVHAQALEKIHESFELSFKETGDYIMIYFRTPCTKPETELFFDPLEPNNINSWDNDCEWENKSDDLFRQVVFEVEVPKGIEVYVSGIMKSEINVTGIDDPIWVQNVEGDIKLDKVQKVKCAKTVQGNIDIYFNQHPSLSGKIHTMMGDIQLFSQNTSDFDIKFKSMTGDFFTGFSNIEIKPKETVTASNAEGFEYKISEYTAIQIGRGGPVLTLETFSGNAYLKSN